LSAPSFAICGYRDGIAGTISPRHFDVGNRSQLSVTRNVACRHKRNLIGLGIGASKATVDRLALARFVAPETDTPE
jgi:hypothetical protein